MGLLFFLIWESVARMHLRLRQNRLNLRDLRGRLNLRDLRDLRGRLNLRDLRDLRGRLRLRHLRNRQVHRSRLRLPRLLPLQKRSAARTKLSKTVCATARALTTQLIPVLTTVITRAVGEVGKMMTM
jgi:hypothetical protein